jgi:ubiquinone/menaquinone biosynthesis C-methylase UbiE
MNITGCRITIKMNEKKLNDRIKDQYDQIAQSWGVKVWVDDEEFKKEIINFADLTGKEKMLEVGIGAGDFARSFGLEDVTGVDISAGMLAECHQKHPTFTLINADGEKLPLQDNSFDLVCCRNYLQNFDDPTQAFKEMVRVVKPRGKIMAVEAAVFKNEREIITEALRIVEPHHPLFPSHELLYDLFLTGNLYNIEQKIVSLHRKWLTKWCQSKQATPAQKKKIYNTWKRTSEQYLSKYNFTFFNNEEEIESTLTFCFLKGIK